MSIKLKQLSADMRAALARINPPHVGHKIPGVLNFRAAARADETAELLIYGNIGDSWWDESVTAKQVVEQLRDNTAARILVRINSYGGSVTDGIAIYNELRAQARRGVIVDGQIDSIAASIASLIAMACGNLQMPETAMLMLHAPWGGVWGNSKAVREYADVLDGYGSAMALAYAKKTGSPAAEFVTMWADGQDNYYSAEEAVAAGLADEIIDSEQDLDEVAAAAAVADDALQALIDRAPRNAVLQLRAALCDPNVFPSQSGTARGEIAMPGNPNRNNNMDPSDAVREQIVAAERERVKLISEFSRERPSMAACAEAAINDGSSFEVFGQRLMQVLGADTTPSGGYREGGPEALVVGLGRSQFSGVTSNHQGNVSAFVEAASDVLAARAGIRIDKPHAGARDIAGLSVAEIAKACLARSERGRNSSDRSVIRAAMTTSDFPAILENTLRKAMGRGYEDEPGTHSAWIRRTTVPDFKEHSRVILASMPDLQRVYEGGEYPYGNMDEDKSVPFLVEKFGRLVGISWEALVNDDLHVLGRVPQAMGQAARRKEADIAYAMFAGSGQVMQDGKTLFHADHGNLAAPSAELDAAALASGRLLMRKQLAFGGGALNLAPRTLLVPAELESDAERIIAASSIHVSAGLESAAPEWIRRLELVVESRLPATAFYLLASNAQIDTGELAYLAVEDGPVVLEEHQFERDVQLYKVRAVMGARALDWRGFVKVPLS